MGFVVNDSFIINALRLVFESALLLGIFTSQISQPNDQHKTLHLEVTESTIIFPVALSFSL
jgi:hypothetical protein